MVELRSMVWASLTPSHFDKFASPEKPMTMFMCDVLYFESFVDHVRGEE